jgi:hypothetical protein
MRQFNRARWRYENFLSWVVSDLFACKGPYCEPGLVRPWTRTHVLALKVL